MSVDRARALRRAQTSAEALLWRALRNRSLNGWKFRRQVSIDRYVVDFACVAARLAVELDGATHSTDADLARDARRTEMIARCGFEIVRFTNIEIYENLDGVREAILAAIENRIVV